MKRQTNLLSKQLFWSMLAFFAAMMLLGSCFDFPISRALYNEKSGFGIFFAAFGEYPAALGFVAAGTLLWLGRSAKSKCKAVLQGLGAAWLILSGTAMAMMLPLLYLSLPTAAVLAIGLICSAAVVLCVALLCKHANPSTMLRVAAIFFLAIFIEMLLVNVIKIPWGRMRMRLVANDPRAYFMPWWQAGCDVKDTLMAAGVGAEQFKSFPSGHVANAATLMLLGLFSTLKETLAGKKGLLVCIGFVWACLVAFSRIVMGAHYLTDTAMGFAVSAAVMLLLCNVVLRAPLAAASLQDKAS